MKNLIFYLLCCVLFVTSCQTEEPIVEETFEVIDLKSTRNPGEVVCEGITDDWTDLTVTKFADGTGRACEIIGSTTNCWNLGNQTQIDAQCDRLMPMRNVIMQQYKDEDVVWFKEYHFITSGLIAITTQNKYYHLTDNVSTFISRDQYQELLLTAIPGNRNPNHTNSCQAHWCGHASNTCYEPLGVANGGYTPICGDLTCTLQVNTEDPDCNQQ